MTTWLTVVPAYGRDYKSKKAVMADWESGKDFRIESLGHPHDGRYINNVQHPDGTILHIRYKGLTQICEVKPPKKVS